MYNNATTQVGSYGPLRETFLSIATSVPANPLFVACAFGLPEILESLATISGVDWFQRNVSSATGLHVAAKYGFANVLQFLIMKKLDVNTTTNSGTTALHLAVEMGQLSSAYVLLRNGANTVNKDFEGWTALDYAIRNRDANMVLLLLRMGVKGEAQLKVGNYIASWEDDTERGLQKLHSFLGRPTGFVGILSEGQTGFLNTNLQMMYMLKPFREVCQLQYV